MAPSPITATHKFVGKYTIDGIQHRCNCFCSAVSSADPSGYDLLGRPSPGDVGFSDVVDPFFTAIAPFFTLADVTFDGAELWEYVGGAYAFRASETTAVTPTLGGYYQKASGFDVVGKQGHEQNIHFYIYEGPFGLATKITTYTGASANVQALIDYLFAVGRTGLAVDAWNWRTSRNDYRVKRWLSGVIDTNEKLRRLRGIK